jgi:hypothetical protein
VLTKHFSQYGEVLRVVPNPLRKTATVHFRYCVQVF